MPMSFEECVLGEIQAITKLQQSTAKIFHLYCAREKEIGIVPFEMVMRKHLTYNKLYIGHIRSWPQLFFLLYFPQKGVGG